MATLLCGVSLGIVVTWSMCGYIIEFAGWPYVFYVTGTLTLIISLIWIRVVYDCPAKHPKIGQCEKEHIENATVGLSNSTQV